MSRHIVTEEIKQDWDLITEAMKWKVLPKKTTNYNTVVHIPTLIFCNISFDVPTGDYMHPLAFYFFPLPSIDFRLVFPILIVDEFFPSAECPQCSTGLNYCYYNDLYNIECCNFYDINDNCVITCGENQLPSDDFVCTCIENYGPPGNCSGKKCILL